MAKPSVSIFWFRRDLRLFDNAGLFHALRSGRPVVPLFIFDVSILKTLSKKDPRPEFIHHALSAIQEKLQTYGSRLDIRIGEPLQIWQELLRNDNVSAVFANEDYEPAAVDRDKKIGDLLQAHSIPFHLYKDQVIFAKDDVVKADGMPYTVFTPFKNKWRERLRPGDLVGFDLQSLYGHFLKTTAKEIPSSADIGFENTGMTFPSNTFPASIIGAYNQNRDFPARAGTTRLGIHLRFGTISIREMIKRGMELSETWVNELIWREFFMQILFHFPRVVDSPFKPAYADITWREDQEGFERWCKGLTGFPIVDAGMRELNATGFMHNRARMITAGFLAKHLLINWQWGEKYFIEKLLDFELASNNGNWQWAAGCGCDAAPYFRVFNPDLQLKKFDPKQEYIIKWIPEWGTSDYPKPMVEHKQARLRALLAFKKSLRVE